MLPSQIETSVNAADRRSGYIARSRSGRVVSGA